MPKAKRFIEKTKIWEANSNTDAKAHASDLLHEKKLRFKRYHQAIHADLEEKTNEFLQFAEEKGAFDW